MAKTLFQYQDYLQNYEVTDQKFNWHSKIDMLTIDHSKIIVNSENGSWLVLDNDEFESYSHHILPTDDSQSSLVQLGLTSSPINFHNESFFSNNMYFFEFAVTNSCNLTCSYCFADASFNIKEKATITIAEKFIDNIYNYWLSLETKNKFIIEFTGGEPLLNFAVIKHTVEYCNTKVKDDIGYFEFVIQTNLISLTADIIQFFVDYNVGIGTSCDGFDHLNDEQRMLSNKNGSHALFLEKLDLVRMLAPSQCRSVISVITEKNVKYMPEIFLYLHTLGFIEVNFRPVAEIGRGHRIMEIEQFSESFVNGLFEIFENIIYPHYMETGIMLHEGNVARTFQNLFTPYRPFMCERSPCGAAKNICITMPNGDIYPCNQSTSEEMNIKLGNIMTDSFEQISNQSIAFKYAERNTDKIEECKSCTFKNWCGSPCPQEGILKKGSFLEKSSDCEIMKNRYIRAFKTLLSNEEYIKVLGSLTKINENSLQWSQFKMY